MIRYLRLLFLAGLGVVLITIAMANRGVVALQLLPETVADFAGYNATVELQLFVVVFGGIVGGLLIGFFWEWMREYKHRAEASRTKQEIDQLTREVSRLKRRESKDGDDLLALIE